MKQRTSKWRKRVHSCEQHLTHTHVHRTDSTNCSIEEDERKNYRMQLKIMIAVILFENRNQKKVPIRKHIYHVNIWCIMAMKWWKEKRSRRNRKHLFDGAEKKIEIFSSVECKRETYIATRKTVNAKLLLILAFDNLINRIMQFSLSKKQNEIRKRML